MTQNEVDDVNVVRDEIKKAEIALNQIRNKHKDFFKTLKNKCDHNYPDGTSAWYNVNISPICAICNTTIEISKAI